MAETTKVALVTGSTSGIGLAIARALAKRGINIVITGFGDETLIKSLVNDIGSFGVRVDYVSGDLSKLSEIESLWAEVIRHYPDGVDILVNNAGVQIEAPVEELTAEQWDLSIAVMLSAPFHLTRLSVPSMKRKGWGRIVNMSSNQGLIAFPQFSAYGAAKHGLLGLTKAVALETAAFGITCNAVCPGYTLTPMMVGGQQKLANDLGVTVDEVLKQTESTLATKKFITPDQVAELVEFVCLSNASSQMTGASYLIDHAYTAQ